MAAEHAEAPAPPPSSAAPAAELRRRLEGAAAGLRYLSEMDAPLVWASAPAPAGPVTAPMVAAAFGIPADTPADERTLDRFFAGQIEDADPADPVAQGEVPRFRALRQALRDTLPEMRAFCFGDAEKRCLLVGRAPDGGLAGLETRVAES